LTGAAQVVARWWIGSGRPVSKSEAVALMETLLWRGISHFPLNAPAPGGRLNLGARRVRQEEVLVEVRIGVLHTPREIVLDSEETQDEVQEQVAAALNDGSGLLTLTDNRGRRVIVPAGIVAYVEIAPADVRRVGFTAS
jgi:hypothetical protein